MDFLEKYWARSYQEAQEIQVSTRRAIVQLLGFYLREIAGCEICAIVFFSLNAYQIFIAILYYLNWKVLDKKQDINMIISQMRANENALGE